MSDTRDKKKVKISVKGLPDTVTHAFIDSDPIAYMGACAVEKTKYKYVKNDGSVETEVFHTAKAAKKWLDDMTGKSTAAQDDELGFDTEENDFNPDEWTRQSWKEIGTEEEAIKKTEACLQDYLFVAGQNIQKWEGYLTEKGTTKNKDVSGLENQYQCNRKLATSPVEPTHLRACRNYLLMNNNIHLIKGGFEADAIVIAKAEKLGEKAVILSKDKDLRQAENVYVIDMSYPADKLEAWKTTKLGDLWFCPIKKKYVGHGFMWLAFQAMAGDNADGYYGLKGYGQKAAVSLLKGCVHTTRCDCLKKHGEVYQFPCKTRQEIVDRMLKSYYLALGNSYTYTSWDGKKVTLTPRELLEQHFWLAHQERHPKDRFTLETHV